MGVVHNVLFRLPGRVSGNALLLMAHYDLMHTGPGAADEGASVAAILETQNQFDNFAKNYPSKLRKPSGFGTY